MKDKQTKIISSKKKKKHGSIFSFLLKLFGVGILIGASFLGYMIYTLKQETPTELIESYSPLSSSIIYDI